MNHNLSVSDGSPKFSTARSFSQRFASRHVMRTGAIIWVKSKGVDYYGVFKSHSRPNRGVQLPGGRVERNENPGYAVIREVNEETGLKTRIVCPLGLLFYENPSDNYSNLQLYFIVRVNQPINVLKKWQHTDKDKTKQKIECWFEPVTKNPDFLAIGQGEVIHMFRDWLEEHKKFRDQDSDILQNPLDLTKSAI